jgi:serine/threonine-protein kinase
MEISGNPAPVLEGVGIKTSGASNFDVATDGRLVYCAAANSFGALRSLAWSDRTGKETPIAAQARNYFYARISPDGSRLSLDVRDEEQDIWTWDIKRESLTRLTDRPGAEQYALWTPDSQRIVFSSVTSNGTDLFQMRPDGTGQIEQITDMAKDNLIPFPNAITPDGKQVVFRASGAASQNDLYVAPLSGARTYTKLLGTEHDELNATISPDGKWMAFQSDLSGHVEVYVRPFPNVDAGQFPVSTAGGSKPLWGKTGEIFYLSADNKMTSVQVSTTKGFVAGKPVALFDAGPFFTGGVGRQAICPRQEPGDGREQGVGAPDRRAELGAGTGGARQIAARAARNKGAIAPVSRYDSWSRSFS